MTAFILACAGLILLSGLFYLIPGRRGDGADGELSKANVEWYRLRQAELARDGVEELEEDARLRLLEDEQQALPPPEAADSRSFRAWLLLPLVALLASGLYYRLGAAPDVLISRQLQSLTEDSTPEQMQALMAAVEARAAERPGNLDYIALLGRYYMGQQNYARAAETYAELAREIPDDAYALAASAQAAYLAGGRELTPQARLMAEQALAVNPHQRTALGLLGMASFEQGQYRAAMEYWQRLLAVEQPGSDSARMIVGVIERARLKLAESGEEVLAATDLPGADAPAAGEPSAGVTVRVALPDGAVVAATDTVFVLARSATSDSRMPIAVQRLQAGQLPATLRLDDGNSMAGQKLSTTESVVVVVQVSPDGRPGEAGATWLGQAGPLAPSLDLEPREILLQPKG